MSYPKVLIIEDDPSIAELISLHLKDLLLEPDVCDDGEEGLARALAFDYELIILDLMLPKLEGKEVLKRIRNEKPRIPILILTLKAEIIDKVVGFELGADDYLTKPFSIHEFIARVKALVRRASRSDEKDRPKEEVIKFNNFKIDLSKRKVTLNESVIELTSKQFDLLAFLAKHPGRVFSRNDLLNSVWGYDHVGYEHTVDSHINRLRSQIEPEPSKPKFILTVWGVGYKFTDNETLEMSKV